MSRIEDEQLVPTGEIPIRGQLLDNGSPGQRTTITIVLRVILACRSWVPSAAGKTVIRNALKTKHKKVAVGTACSGGSNALLNV